jgi:polyferredoxin
MTAGLVTRSSLDLAVLKDRGAPYVRTLDGQIRNAYTLKLVNKARSERELSLSIEGLPGASLEVIGQDATGATARLVAEPDGVERYRLLVTAPEDSASGDGEVRFVLEGIPGERVEVAAPFSGPGRGQ